jgi:hypothetical protein
MVKRPAVLVDPPKTWQEMLLKMLRLAPTGRRLERASTEPCNNC